MTSKHAERPNTVPWPPILLVTSLLIGFALDARVPLGWPAGMWGDLTGGLGLFLIVIAIIIDIGAMRTMFTARTTILPHRGSDRLVTGGIFRFSRNPIYVANALLLIGIGLFVGNLWLLAMAVINAIATQKLAIEREEAHLEARFGKTYRDYKKKVNRWL
ncbi:MULTISPECIES: isoprenylcysteine carboxylmethyltransferase family protein [unclassified Roseitalea]|uniref:methyltransferase family protein n=1 Tax=unclassified Roseitalea TaxID=2639107 RepID=UPI00273FCA4F|nr:MULTISPECIES: isoprenylcysteine carboxylmethyltransferase family protein [unclassified Roseitalea]